MVPKKLWGAIALLGSFVFLLLIQNARLEYEFKTLQKLPVEVREQATEAVVSIGIAKAKAIDSLQAEATAMSRELAELRRQKALQVAASLPGQIDVDSLQAYYEAKSRTQSIGAIYESFDTENGKISFYGSDVSVVTIPSTRQMAWVRIGKTNSRENAELIKAWLSESCRSRERQGFLKIQSTSKATDYGEATQKQYRKGDLFFETYYEHARNQGTYNSKYLTYTYYVQVGSEARRRQYMAEQYDTRLGR
jgi:hypothetical protein